MALAGGRKTVEQSRSDAAERQKQSRERKKIREDAAKALPEPEPEIPVTVTETASAGVSYLDKPWLAAAAEGPLTQEQDTDAAEGDDPFHLKLTDLLHEVRQLIQNDANWPPDMSQNKRRKRDKAVKEFVVLAHELGVLAERRRSKPAAVKEAA